MSDTQRDFDRLFRQYYRLVFLYLRNRGLDEDKAADLAQETFMRAYQGLAEFRGESSPKTWLFSITRNVWRNHLRNRSRLKRNAPETPLEDLREDGWEPSDEDQVVNPLQDTIEIEEREQIWEAIGKLPPRMRRCVMLRVGQDKKYREIADVMQVSIQTVRSQLSQGRTQLQGLLNDYFEEWL
ncbi:MAG: RNA polymerase sigma factor [Thermoanaerobaculia bacterium]|nr:RNA polymerase sigma factor [Thermoanaerobaculia bacterium]